MAEGSITGAVINSASPTGHSEDSSYIQKVHRVTLAPSSHIKFAQENPRNTIGLICLPHRNMPRSRRKGVALLIFVLVLVFSARWPLPPLCKDSARDQSSVNFNHC